MIKLIYYMISIKKIILNTLKIAIGLVVFFVLAVVTSVWLINKPSTQDKVLKYATEMLAEKLNTKVEIDSIRIGFFREDIQLYGLRVDDQQQRRMLELQSLSAEFRILPIILHQEVNLEEINVKGLHAYLYKPSPDEPANFQFVIDAFQTQKKKKENGN